MVRLIYKSPMVKTTVLEETMDFISVIERNNIPKVDRDKSLLVYKNNLKSLKENLSHSGALLESIDVDTAIYYLEMAEARL